MDPHTPYQVPITPAAKPPRPRWVIPAIAAVVLVAVAAISVFGILASQRPVAPASAAKTSTPTQPTRTSRPPKDPKVVDVCSAVITADASDLAAMAALGSRAADTTDYDIHFQGMLLRDTAQMAIESVGDRDETARKLDVLTEGIKLRTACIKGGYE